MLGFLVKLEIMHWVVGWLWLECGWEGFGHARCWGARQGWRWCRCLGGVGGSRCHIGEKLLRGGADADFVGGSSVMMVIGYGSVSV